MVQWVMGRTQDWCISNTPSSRFQRSSRHGTLGTAVLQLLGYSQGKKGHTLDRRDLPSSSSLYTQSTWISTVAMRDCKELIILLSLQLRELIFRGHRLIKQHQVSPLAVARPRLLGILPMCFSWVHTASRWLLPTRCEAVTTWWPASAPVSEPWCFQLWGDALCLPNNCEFLWNNPSGFTVSKLTFEIPWSQFTQQLILNHSHRVCSIPTHRNYIIWEGTLWS